MNLNDVTKRNDIPLSRFLRNSEKPIFSSPYDRTPDEIFTEDDIMPTIMGLDLSPEINSSEPETFDMAHYAEVISSKMAEISNRNAELIPNENFVDADKVFELLSQLPKSMLMIVRSICDVSDECDEYGDVLCNPFNVLYGILTRDIIENRGEWSYFLIGLANAVNSDCERAYELVEGSCMLHASNTGRSELLRDITEYTNYDMVELCDDLGVIWDDDCGWNGEYDEDEIVSSEVEETPEVEEATEVEETPESHETPIEEPKEDTTGTPLVFEELPEDDAELERLVNGVLN